jgi:hypothetical protein
MRAMIFDRDGTMGGRTEPNRRVSRLYRDPAELHRYLAELGVLPWREDGAPVVAPLRKAVISL